MYCADWLRVYKFKHSHTKENRLKAESRNGKYDKRVFLWTALYAQLICSFDYDAENFTIESFCKNHNVNHLWEYIRLKDVNYTCETWLHLYGFDIAINNPTNTIQPTVTNWRRAKNRNTKEDCFISIWAAGYARVLSAETNENNAITTKAFCEVMRQIVGLPNEGKTPFMSYMDTKKTCEEWIQFSGYGKDLAKNKVIALEALNYEVAINTWAHLYASQFRDNEKCKIDNASSSNANDETSASSDIAQTSSKSTCIVCSTLTPKRFISKIKPKLGSSSSKSKAAQSSDPKDILTPTDFCKHQLSNRTNHLQKMFSYFHDQENIQD